MERIHPQNIRNTIKGVSKEGKLESARAGIIPLRRLMGGGVAKSADPYIGGYRFDCCGCPGLFLFWKRQARRQALTSGQQKETGQHNYRPGRGVYMVRSSPLDRQPHLSSLPTELHAQEEKGPGRRRVCSTYPRGLVSETVRTRPPPTIKFARQPLKSNVNQP